MNIYKKRKQLTAFTLCEILIVVGIIGVVAELTIPTLTEDVNTTARVTSLKKSYSVLSSAYTLAVQNDGTPDNWNLGTALADPTAALNILNELSPSLKITKNCGNNPGCFPDIAYGSENGDPSFNINTYSSYAKAILADGSLMATYVYNGTCSASLGSGNLQNVCGAIVIDVNGNKSPNRWGVDLFEFILTKNGIVPGGTPNNLAFTFDGFCRDKTKGFITDWGFTGEGCTAWVIYNGNQDYLKDNCSNLAWGGKTKCN